MKIKSKVVETKEIYIANDGKEFSFKRDCEIYERYYPQTIYDIIRDYCIIENEKDIEKYKTNEVPVFTYLLVTKEIPDDKIEYCKIIGDNDIRNVIPSISSYEEPTLFYNDWSSSFNGGMGYSDGWKRIGDKESIERSIKKYQNLLEKYQNLLGIYKRIFDK